MPPRPHSAGGSLGGPDGGGLVAKGPIGAACTAVSAPRDLVFPGAVSTPTAEQYLLGARPFPSEKIREPQADSVVGLLANA